MRATVMQGDKVTTVRLSDGSGMPFAAYRQAVALANEFGDIECRFIVSPKTKEAESFVEFSISSKAYANVSATMRRLIGEAGIELV